MPNYHLSKRDHLHHHAKWGLHDLGKQMVGGNPLDAGVHEELAAQHAEADKTPHLFLCCLCWQPYKPKAPNDDARLFCHAVLLPGGEMVRPEYAPDGRQMEIPIAMCANCRPERIGRFINHDWDEHDHRGRPLKRKQARKASRG
jgi:hypothetical protein